MCVVGEDLLAQVDHGEVGAAGADVGEQDVPAAAGTAPAGRPGGRDPAVGRVPSMRSTPRLSSSSTAALTVVRASPAAGDEVGLALRRRPTRPAAPPC